MGVDCLMAKYTTTDADESITLPVMVEDQHDYELGIGNLFRLSGNAVRAVTGIAHQEGMPSVRLVNVGTYDIVLKNEDNGSEATNRIVTGNGEDTILTPEDTALLTRDTISNIWRLIA